jgi:integrase
MRTAQFTPTKFPDRARPWCVSIPAAYSPSGRRERKFFDTQKDANNFAKAERIRIDREGRTAGAMLSAIQREAAAAAFRLIPNEAPAKLLEIVEQWKTRRELATKSETLSVVFARYITRGKKRKGRGGMVALTPFSAKHKRGIEYAQEAVTAHKEKKIAELTAKDISTALAGCSASYHNAHLRIIRAVCEYAVEKKWSADNVADDVEMKTKAAHKAATTATETPILTIEQARRLLEVADDAAPQYVPFLALTLFAGIRPDLESGEILELTWDMVQLKDKRLVIPGNVSKTDSRRVIEMEDALVDWLNYYVTKRRKADKIDKLEGEIVPKTNLRQRMRLLRKLADVKWEQDIARHTFASYHLSAFENLARCVESMGHRDSAMLWKHYKASVPRDVALEYWKITPAKLGLSAPSRGR